MFCIMTGIEYIAGCIRDYTIAIMLQPDVMSDIHLAYVRISA